MLKVRKEICQGSSHLPLEISYADKSQDDIGWYKLIWVGIDLRYNQCQTVYIKEGKFSNMGINRSISFI